MDQAQTRRNLAAANAEFQSFLNQFKQETPKHFPAAFYVSVQPIIEPYVHRTGRTLVLLFASVILLLLIGCANCSIILLARGESRQHELAIRSAIGASRCRIVRQLLIESLAISCTGAVIGVAASYWLAELPLRLMPDAFPQEAAITINLPILAFSIALAIFSGLLFASSQLCVFRGQTSRRLSKAPPVPLAAVLVKARSMSSSPARSLSPSFSSVLREPRSQAS
jgi:ABC-type antimicrobial peptide transport system permease subunit